MEGSDSFQRSKRKLSVIRRFACFHCGDEVGEIIGGFFCFVRMMFVLFIRTHYWCVPTCEYVVGQFFRNLYEPFFHLICCFIGEGYGEYARNGCVKSSEQVGDFIGEYSCFSTSGSCNNQRSRLRMEGGFGLFVIEF